MREILFRGKRVDNGEWIEGVPIKTYDTEIGINLPLRYKANIFEGDIVKVYDVYCNETVVGVVEFCDGSFRIYDKDFTSYDRWMYCKVEVIGNVYDNQELLEGDKT